MSDTEYQNQDKEPQTRRRSLTAKQQAELEEEKRRAAFYGTPTPEKESSRAQLRAANEAMYDWWKYDRNNLAYTDETEITPETGEWSDFGNSRHDADVVAAPTYGQGELNEMRAADQGFWEKVGLGATKMTTTAATTFLDNTVGFLWGGISALMNGDASKIYDNDFTNAMADFNEWCEEQMPHYSSKYEGWGADFWGNFIGKDILQNAGFQIGTGLSMIVPGAMLKVPGQAFKATKMFSNFMKTGRAINTGNAAKDLVISTYAAVGEASIEALDNKRNFVKYQKQVADDEFKAKNAELDMQWKQLVATKYGGDEDAARSSMDFNDYWNKQNELKRMRSDKEKFIQKEAEKVVDMTFLANLALVGGTNFSTFGKAFTGYNLNKRFGDIAQDIVDAEGKVLKKNVWNNTAKDVIKSGKYKVKNENYGKWVRNAETGKLEKDTREYIEKAAKVEARAKEKSVGFNIAKDMFFEGLEEMNQETAAQYSAGIAETEMLQYEALANSGMAYDDILKQMNNTWFSYGEMTKALGKVYTDPQQYRQFFGGALGMVFSPHFTKKPGGGLQFHLNNIGAQSAAIREQNSTNAYIAEQINKTLNSDESKNYLTGLLRHSALERVKQGAVASDNRMDYEDADFAQFVSDITMMGNAGKLDLLQARLEGMRNMSDDEMEKVCMQLAEQVDKKGKSEVIGDFVDNNGNYLGNTDADKLKIREKINKRIDRLQKDISLYQKTMNDIDGATGGKLDHQTLATFTWEKAQLMNKYARAKDIIGSKAKDSIGVYRKHLSSKLLTLNTNLKLSESSLKQEKESLAKKKTADGKPIEPSELQKNLEKEIENYTKQIKVAMQVDSLLDSMGEKLQIATDDHKSDKDIVTALFEQYKSFKDKMPDVFAAMKWRDKDGKVIEDDEQKPKDFSLEQLLVTGQFDNFMSVMTGTDQADKVKDLKDAAKLYQHAKAAEESLEKLLENPLQFTDQRTKFEEEVATFTNKDLIKSLKKELSKGIDAGDITLQNLQEKAEELAKTVIESRREGIKGKITSVLESGTDVELIKKKAIESILNDKKYKDLRDLMDFINQVNFRIAVNQKASQEAKQVALETFNRIVRGKKNVEEITETKLELKDFDTNSLLVEESDEIKQQKLNALKGGMPNLTFDLNNYQFTEESKTNAAIARNEAKELLESVLEEADNAINKPQLRENQEKDNESEQIKKESEILDKRYDGVLKSVNGLIANFKKGEVLEENDITELIEQMQKIADDKFNPKDFHESLSKLVDSKRQQLYGDIWRIVDEEIKQRKYNELEKDFTEEEKENNKVVKQAFAEINKTLSKVQKALEKSDDKLVTLGVFDSIAVEDGSYELKNSVEGCYFYDGQVYRGNMVKVSVPNQQGEFYAVAFKTGVDKFDWFLIDSNGAVVNDNLQTDYAMFPTTRQGINSTITFGDVELTSPNALSLQLFKELQPLEIPTAGDARSVRLQNKKCEFCRQLLIDNGVLDENGKVKTKGNLAQSVVAANVIMNDSLTSSVTEAEQVTETIEGNIQNSDRQYRVFFDNERDELVRVVLIGKTIHYKDENGKTWTRNIKKELKKKNDDGSRKNLDDVLRELHGQDIEIVNSSKEDLDSDIDINKQEQNVQQPQNEQGSQTVTEQKPTETPQQRKVVENKKNILRIKRTVNQLDEQIAELDSMLKRLQDAAKQNPQYHDTVRTVTTFKQYVEFVRNNYKALEEPKNIVLDENQVFSMMDSFRQQLGKIFGNDVQFLSDEEIEQAAKDAQAQFHIGKKARTEFENKLHKARPDMSDAEIKATLDFLHELADNKENNAFVKAAVTWVANKSITLPEDYEKVRQVFDVARKKNIDVQKYKTFGELMSAPEMQKKEKEKKAFNPDEAKTFSNKRTVRVSSRREFVVYDVENTEEGQQDVVSAIAVHYESSPWCLATFTNTGKPTESAKTYWNKYNGISRKIAFENGRPVAFCSAEQKFTLNGYNVVKDVNGKYFVDDILSDNEISKLVNIDDYLTGETDEEGYELSEKGIKEVKQVENQEDAWWDLNDEYPQEKLGTWVATKRTRKDDPDGWIHEDNFTEALLDDLENSEREAREEQEDWDLNHFDIDDLPFSKSNGEIYGFTNEGKIILNKDKFRLDTPVHEYTHLWDKACIEHSPELWKRGVELMKQTDEWQRVIEDNNYANIKDNEDLVASEVHSRLSGMLAAGKAISFAGNKRIKKGFWAKLIEWFRQFKDFTLRRVFGMSKEDAQKVTLEQFLSAPVADFMLGTDPRKINKNAYIQSKTKSTQQKTKKHDFNIGDTVQYGSVVDEKFTPITNDANIVAINGDDITIEYNGKKVKTKSKYLRFLYGARPSSQYSGNEKNVKTIEQKLGKKELSEEEAFARFIANSDITINEQEAKNVRDVNKKLVSSDGLAYDSIASLFKQNNEAFATIDDEEIRTWISEMFANEDGRLGIEKYAAQLHYDALDKNWEAEVNRIQQALNNETDEEADNKEEPDYVFSDEEYNKYLSQVAEEIANEEADRQLYDEVMIQEIESMTNSSFDLLSDDEKQEYIKGYEEYQEQRIKEETNQTFEEYWQNRLNEVGNEPINDDAELADFYEPIYDKVNKLKNEEVPPTQLNVINDNSEQNIKNQIDKTAKSERNDIELDTFKPSISEFGISNHREHALTEIANSPKERKKIAEGKLPGDYRYIYSLYQATGAFDYVKQGKLKAGQEVFIGYGKVGQAGSNTFNNAIFFVKDENGEYQMIGTLSDMAERDPNSAKKLHYFLENEYNNKSNFERITITAKSTNDYFKANQPIHFDLYKPNGNYLTTNVSKVLNGSLLFSESRHSLKDVKLPNNKTIEQAINDSNKTDIAIAFYTSDLQLTGNANFTATADELKKMKAFKNVRSEVSGHIVLAIDKPDGRKQLIPLRVATVAEIINKPKNFVADKINKVIDQIYEVYSSKSNDLNGKNRNLIVLINKLQTLVHEPTQAGIHIYANPNKAIKIQVGMYNPVTLKNDDKTVVSKDEFRKELLRQLDTCFININEDVMNDETRINSYINSDVFSTELEETSYRNAFFTVNPIDGHGNKLNKKKDIKDNLILKRKDVSEIVWTIGKKSNQDIVVVRTKKGEYKVMLMYNDVLNNVSISEYSTEQQLRMIDYAKLKAGQKSDKDTLINEAYIETTDKTVGPQDVILHTTEYGSRWYYDPTNFSTTTGNIYTLDSDGNKKYIYKTPDFDDINNDEQQTFDGITIKTEGKQKGEQGKEPQSQSSELPNYVKDKETITTLLSINNIESFVRFFNKFSNDEMFDIIHGRKKLFGIDRTNYESYLNKIGEDFLIKTCNFLYKYDADVLSELHSKFEDEIDMGSEFDDIINDSKNEIMSILENHRKKDIEEKNSCNFGI